MYLKIGGWPEKIGKTYSFSKSSLKWLLHEKNTFCDSLCAIWESVLKFFFLSLFICLFLFFGICAKEKEECCLGADIRVNLCSAQDILSLTSEFNPIQILAKALLLIIPCVFKGSVGHTHKIKLIGSFNGLPGPNFYWTHCALTSGCVRGGHF